MNLLTKITQIRDKKKSCFKSHLWHMPPQIKFMTRMPWMLVRLFLCGDKYSEQAPGIEIIGLRFCDKIEEL